MAKNRCCRLVAKSAAATIFGAIFDGFLTVRPVFTGLFGILPTSLQQRFLIFGDQKSFLAENRPGVGF